MAVWMKTLSPQMIGVAWPSPGILIFHLMFSVSLHLVGGLALGATPFWSGPRHWGQLSPELAAAPKRFVVRERAPTQNNDVKVLWLIMVLAWREWRLRADDIPSAVGVGFWMRSGVGCASFALDGCGWMQIVRTGVEGNLRCEI